MKMQFSTYLKTNGNREIVEAKNEDNAFEIACEKFGANNFSQLKRYFDGETSKNHKMVFLKRAISNIPKHEHKVNRRGFKKS